MRTPVVHEFQDRVSLGPEYSSGVQFRYELHFECVGQILIWGDGWARARKCWNWQNCDQRLQCQVLLHSCTGHAFMWRREPRKLGLYFMFSQSIWSFESGMDPLEGHNYSNLPSWCTRNEATLNKLLFGGVSSQSQHGIKQTQVQRILEHGASKPLNGLGLRLRWAIQPRKPRFNPNIPKEKESNPGGWHICLGEGQAAKIQKLPFMHKKSMNLQ